MPRFRLENKNKGVALLSLGVPQWIVRVLRGNTVNDHGNSGFPNTPFMVDRSWIVSKITYFLVRIWCGLFRGTEQSATPRFAGFGKQTIESAQCANVIR
jgi:hypothetical protein